MRVYWIVATNCDCASDKIAVLKNTKWKFGPRCPSCGKILGPMQYLIVGEARARYNWAALRKFSVGEGIKYDDL